MRRIPIEPRPNSTRLVASQGLVYADSESTGPDGSSGIYWPDDRYYSFTSEEIELLELAGKDVFDMCCEAAEYLVEHPEVITEKMAVPAFALKQIKKSWEREPTWGSVYGRFDICFGGIDHPDPRLRTPKFYEFNADTPTSLVEAAEIQWKWLEQTGHGNDQLNSISDRLVAAWRRNKSLIKNALGHEPTIWFALDKAEPSGEDLMNTTLLMDTARQAGWTVEPKTEQEPEPICMGSVGLGRDGRFYTWRGEHKEHIDVIFKLYPWETMFEQGFELVFENMERIGQRNEGGEYVGGTVWIEAPYKMLWSNKAIFAILWELFEDDPRSQWLLPTYFENEAPESLTKYARKPIFSREGADIRLHEDDRVTQDATTGEYGKEGYIVQELALPPTFEDEQGTPYYPVLGLWFVDGEVAGMGIREDRTPITTNGSTFVPHSISDGPVNYERKPVPSLEEIEAKLFELNTDAEDVENREMLKDIERMTADQ